MTGTFQREKVEYLVKPLPVVRKPGIRGSPYVYKGIPCIDMYAPYARLLLDEHKTIETRTYNRFKIGVRYAVVVSASAPWSNIF